MLAQCPRWFQWALEYFPGCDATAEVIMTHIWQTHPLVPRRRYASHRKIRCNTCCYNHITSYPLFTLGEHTISMLKTPHPLPCLIKRAQQNWPWPEFTGVKPWLSTIGNHHHGWVCWTMSSSMNQRTPSISSTVPCCWWQLFKELCIVTTLLTCFSIHLFVDLSICLFTYPIYSNSYSKSQS